MRRLLLLSISLLLSSPVFAAGGGSEEEGNPYIKNLPLVNLCKTTAWHYDGEKEHSDEKDMDKHSLHASSHEKAHMSHEYDESKSDANYRYGYDKNGRPVVPPDLYKPGVTFFPILIPLQLDIIEKFKLDVPLGIIADANLAGIQIQEDGRVTYNGHPISEQVQHFCDDKHIVHDFDEAEAAKAAEKDGKKKKEDHGDDKVDGEAH